MIILGLLLEVMDLSAADLDNVTRPRLPANAASQPAAPAAPANGQSQLAALLGGLHGSWQRAQRQEKERATTLAARERLTPHPHRGPAGRALTGLAASVVAPLSYKV
jgi:hypothetical protein